jgi:hypothetical protein
MRDGRAAESTRNGETAAPADVEDVVRDEVKAAEAELSGSAAPDAAASETAASETAASDATVSGVPAPADGAPADAVPADGAPGNPHDTVEAVVREQLSKALGGVRGMIEAAVPTIAFTATFVVLDEVRTAVFAGIGVAVLLVLIRLAQRSNPQFVLNSLLGIAIAAFFAMRSGEAEDAFLPGILINTAYAAGMLLSIIVRWPVVGFLIGSVTGDPTAWRRDPGIVKLCSRLTWILLAPCVLRVVVQYPIWLAEGDQSGVLGAAKIAMGWPLQVAALALMVWVVARGRTPVESRA